MSKVLVTGGSGFIGSNIVKKLNSKGYEVNMLDIWGLQIDGAACIKGSVLNVEDIEKAIQGCDYVIHLAAILGVSRSTHKPVECLDVNIQGTRNVLQACIKHHIKKIIFSSSSEVYGEPDKVPITEDMPLQPKSEYGVSKVVGEEYLKSFHRQYKLNYAIVRFFNVYGLHQEPWWVMSRFITNVSLGKPPIVYGDGSQVRAFCNVKDAAEGIIAAMEKANNEVFNIGNSKEQISMKQLAERVSRLGKFNKNITYIALEQSDRSKEREIYKRIPDTSKAKKILGFEAEISLDEGIKEILDYNANHLEEVKQTAAAVEATENRRKNGN
ncbi:MAG TPA: NAD-dependent epimerase/dehydratase family protein [Candidatus Nanoarchaeia archaeon]|nr:NAD-dependent epimerase/dehydratase family protein [Candidatus Nanoarchaeia archaeon]